MEPANVVKCKSSNSAKTSRSEHRNKKSRSSAEFPPYVPKKRGVYVGPTRLRANELEKNQAQERPKAPPRPKPGNKKFLASVLTILSKSTTGTQHPEVHDQGTRKIDRRLKRKPSDRREQEVEQARNKRDRTKEVEIVTAKTKKKPKYRSKVLNNEVDKEVNRFVVLQSQKEIIQTPSIYSENDSFNWSNLPSLVKRAQQKEEKTEVTTSNNTASELAKEIMEGQQYKKERRVRIDEPNTLVADTKEKNPNEVVETNGKLYNFFVDLLETTISVYNVKEDYDKMPPAGSDPSSAKLPEINESVAKKLNEPREKTDKYEAISQPSSHFVCLKDLEYANRSPDPEPDIPIKSPKKRKYKPSYAQRESFLFPRNSAPKKKVETTMEGRKSPSKKEKKKNLLNMFKEQLKMDDSAFEEPQNLYQALKVIAQNKRRCQRTIHFEESRRRRNNDYGFPECMFKRRKVISPSTKGTKNSYPSVSGRYSEFSGRAKSEHTTDMEDHGSYHSLEVYGYDYETPAMRKVERMKMDREFLMTYHSSPTHSDKSLASTDLLHFSETDSRYFF